MRKLILMHVVATAAGLYLTAGSSLAATFTTFNDRTLFLNSLLGPPIDTEDFEGFAVGTDLDGVDFITGVNVTSNAESVEVFGGVGNQDLFAFDDVTRTGPPDLYYDINASSTYKAIGFDIAFFDPATPGPGVMEVFFSDGMSTSPNIFPANPTEDDPIFFGVTSDTTIERIRWTEGPEEGGSGNEETSLDNFVVGRPISEPSTLTLAAPGLLGMVACRWRRAQNITPNTLTHEASDHFYSSLAKIGRRYLCASDSSA